MCGFNLGCCWPSSQERCFELKQRHVAHHSSADTRVAEPLREEAESRAASLLLSCRYVVRKQGPQKHAGWEAKELSLLPDIGWLGTKVRVGGVASYMLEDAKANSFVIMSPTMILELIRPRQLAVHRAIRSAVMRARGEGDQKLGCQRGCSCFGRKRDAAIK